MKKHLYEIKRLDIPAYLKWWFIKYRNAGTLSEVMENLLSPITLLDSLRRKFKIFEIGGNSVQDGEPTPESPVPIQNVTGDVEVEVKNGNLFFGSLTNGVHNAGGDVGNTGTNVYRYLDIPLKPGTYKYNLLSTNFSRIRAVNLSTKTNLANPFTITSENIVSFSFRKIDNTEWDAGEDANVIKFMLCDSNNDDTNFIEAEQQTVTFPLEEGQVLHEGDTIEDKIVQRRKTIILDGTERIEKEISSSAELGFYYKLYLPTKAKYINATSVPNTMLSTHFKIVENNILRYKSGCMSLSSSGLFVAFGITSTEDTVEKVQTWLAENLPKLEYELETPLEIPFTEAQTTAKAQIDSLISYKGTTHISSDNNPSPTFKIQYVKED